MVLIVLVVMILGLLIYHFFGKDYEFTNKEQEELELIRMLKSINESEHILNKISHKEYLKVNQELAKMVDEVEKRNRKWYWWLQ